MLASRAASPVPARGPARGAAAGGDSGDDWDSDPKEEATVRDAMVAAAEVYRRQGGNTGHTKKAPLFPKRRFPRHHARASGQARDPKRLVGMCVA